MWYPIMPLFITELKNMAYYKLTGMSQGGVYSTNIIASSGQLNLGGKIRIPVYLRPDRPKWAKAHIGPSLLQRPLGSA
jgi:hypothetical protein